MPTWKPDPALKVESDSTDISGDSVSVIVWRLENAVSRAKLVANDYQGKNFIANLDAFDNLKVSCRYGSDSWEKVFDGIIEDVSPTVSTSGQLVFALAYGQGRALRNTHCNVNYGAESENHSLDTPEEIWDDLVDNHINKSFDGTNTGYAITKTYIAALANPTINFIHNPYRPCIQVINEVAQIYTGYRAGSASVHWFVDPSKNLYINTIGAHEDSGTWPNFWNSTEAASTLVQGTDLLSYSFSKRVHSKDYANLVLLSTDLRKPGYDKWTEDGGAALWGTAGHGSTAITDSNAQFVVGSHSARLYCDASQSGRIFYPSGENAGWDLTKIGSEQSVPSVKFYIRRSGSINTTSQIRFFTTDNDNDYFYVTFATLIGTGAVTWGHYNVPIGPYYKTLQEERVYRWSSSGSPDWSNINGFCIWISVGASGYGEIFLDDLHLTGKILREASDTSEITSYDECQITLSMNSSVDDTLKASDDSGTAGRLAYAELLTRVAIPIVGVVQVPGITDILPGQKVHIHADKQSSGAFRVDKNFRCKEIVHTFNTDGFRSTLHLTDDLTNTFAKGPIGYRDLYSKVMFVDPEAQSLKTTGLDPLVPRLAKAY